MWSSFFGLGMDFGLDYGFEPPKRTTNGASGQKCSGSVRSCRYNYGIPRRYLHIYIYISITGCSVLVQFRPHKEVYPSLLYVGKVMNSASIFGCLGRSGICYVSVDG